MRPGPRPRVQRAPLVVGSVAAAIRLFWVLLASREPVGLSDPAIYLSSAASIAAGDGYTSLLGEPTAYYPPGYPYFLGAVHWFLDLFGAGEHMVVAVGVLQALLGGLAAGALVVAGRALAPGAPARLGIAAGLIFAFWPNLVVHTGTVLSESLFLAGFCVLLAALLTSVARGSTPWFPRSARDAALPAVIVMSTAVCTLVRPQSVVLLVPAAVVAHLICGVPWRKAGAASVLLIVGMLLAIGPWTLRNAVVMDAFVPMSTNTGDNLCIGFNTDADGTFALTDRCATEGRYVDGPEVEVARDAELRDRAVRWILDNPGRVPGLAVDKVWATFAHDTDGIAAWESYGADPHLGDGARSALRWTSDLYYWAAALAALGGVAVVVAGVRRERRAGDAAVMTGQVLVVLVLLSGVLVPMAFFGDARFKVPVVPCMALLASLLLVRLRRQDGLPAATQERVSEPVT